MWLGRIPTTVFSRPCDQQHPLVGTQSFQGVELGGECHLRAVVRGHRRIEGVGALHSQVTGSGTNPNVGATSSTWKSLGWLPELPASSVTTTSASTCLLLHTIQGTIHPPSTRRCRSCRDERFRQRNLTVHATAVIRRKHHHRSHGVDHRHGSCMALRCRIGPLQSRFG